MHYLCIRLVGLCLRMAQERIITKTEIPEKMRKFMLDLEVKSVERLHERYVLFRLVAGGNGCELPPMVPGQFVEVRVDGSPTTFLRRPISIHFVDRRAGELRLLVALVGDGTRQLATLTPGHRLNCLLPLGNGFTLPTADCHPLLVGGGVGVAPLLYLGAELRRLGVEPTFLLGARTATDLLMLDEFASHGRVFVTTEDGSQGEQGFVTQHTLLGKEMFGCIYTCGPTPMMKAVAAYASKKDIDCEASLENVMACGLGACLCCVEKTTEGNLCVCKDGPVFNVKRLLWQI